MKIAIAGLGLIGGSMAKAIKARTGHTVAGYDISEDTQRKAITDGTLHEAGHDVFSDADIVLVALCPNDAEAFIRRIQPTLRVGTTVIDLCGVKRSICEGMSALFKHSGTHFIGGHPMAGRERSGYENADAALFDGASMILTPPPDMQCEIVNAAEEFFLSIGFGHIELTTPERHDAIIAYTSQLAHVVSSAYIQNPSALDYRGFSAGSFKDLTRVARLDENMWTELFLHNADYLAAQLDTVIGCLSSFREAVGSGDEERLRAMLRRGREMKEAAG